MFVGLGDFQLLASPFLVCFLSMNHGLMLSGGQTPPLQGVECAV